MVRLVVPMLVLLALVSHARAEAPKPVTALKGLDPVELVAGKEVAGKADLAITHVRYRYLFASAENKAAFEKKPEAFAVQLGGSCGRMGPLSGACTTERFVVHDKRIYVFSSESCRNNFKLNPELHLDLPDAPLKGTAAELKRGHELVELALTGFGGAKAVDALTSYRVESSLSYPQKDKPPFVMKKVVTAEFPGKFREEDSYTGWSGVNAATPIAGFQTSRTVAWSMDATSHDFFIRQSLRDPLAILKSRAQKGFVAVAGKKAKVGDVEVEELIVGIHGATTTLSLDPKTGRVLQIAFRGRAGGPIGDVTRTFSDFRATGNLTVPFGVQTTFDGKPLTNPGVTTDSFIVNPKSDPKLFEKPE